MSPELKEFRQNFRFTWHNTREGVRVWVLWRRKWHQGTVVSLGRKRVGVVMDDKDYAAVQVRYEDLRKERPDEAQA